MIQRRTIRQLFTFIFHVPHAETNRIVATKAAAVNVNKAGQAMQYFLFLTKSTTQPTLPRSHRMSAILRTWSKCVDEKVHVANMWRLLWMLRWALNRSTVWAMDRHLCAVGWRTSNTESACLACLIDERVARVDSVPSPVNTNPLGNLQEIFAWCHGPH